MTIKEIMKLNLGSGRNPVPGYINVDKFGAPDIKCDLEMFPWPWESNSVDEILLNHVLEHLGESTETYLSIMKEMYRVCKPGATVTIVVPHPRHDDFLNDPTHVRPVTADSLGLFSKRLNQLWEKQGASNTPLGEYLDIDFDISGVNYALDGDWAEKLQKGAVSEQEIQSISNRFNNVIKEIKITLMAIK